MQDVDWHPKTSAHTSISHPSSNLKCYSQLTLRQSFKTIKINIFSQVYYFAFECQSIFGIFTIFTNVRRLIIVLSKDMEPEEVINDDEREEPRLLKIWSPILERYLNVKQNVDIIASRPFVALRSIGYERGFPAITTIGDILEGPSSYLYIAVNHQIVTSAYVKASLHSLGLYLYFFSKIMKRIVNSRFFFSAR